MNAEDGGVSVKFYVMSEAGVMPGDAINNAIEVCSFIYTYTQVILY